MKKMSLLFLLLSISAGSVYAMEMQWGASSLEEVNEGLELSRAGLRATMRALSENKGKSDAQLNAEIDADVARELQDANTRVKKDLHGKEKQS